MTEHKSQQQLLIKELTKALVGNDPLALEADNRPPVVIIPFTTYQKLKAKRETRLRELKQELNGILTLIRSHVHRQSLEEVEAELAALRKKIEQETEKS